MQTTKRGFISIDQTLDLYVDFSNPVSLIPVDLGQMYRSIVNQTNCRYSL